MEGWDLCMVFSGTMDAELEVQRTIKRAELTAFLCLPKKVVGPVHVHVGIVDELLVYRFILL